jgi:SpoVK/Ycf46/Vps4 family AAA+-type ATPase
MMRTQTPSTAIFLGSSVVPLVYVEVTPLVVSLQSLSHSQSTQPQPPPSLTNFSVKHALQKRTRVSTLSMSSDDDSEERIKIEFEPTRTTTSRGTNGLSSGHLWLDANDTPPIRATALGDGKDKSPETTFPVFYLPSDDPSIVELQPCRLVAYAQRPYTSSTTTTVANDDEVVVTSATLMRVLPPKLVVLDLDPHRLEGRTTIPTTPPLWLARDEFLQQLSGELGQDFLSTGKSSSSPSSLQAEEVLRNHNPDTVKELTLRMSLLLSQPIQIGTTSDALRYQKHQTQRTSRMKHAIQSHCTAKNIPLHSTTTTTTTDPRHDHKKPLDPSTNTTGPSALPWEPSLMIHSPNHADGKTVLVQAIAASQSVGCSHIHILRPGPLLAKYGSHADAALESLLHAIVVSAAAVQTKEESKNKICIILDHVDAMVPSRLSGRSSAGDAAAPVFNAIASHLRALTGSLQRLHEFPFPLLNPLYNHSSSSSSSAGGEGGTGGGRVLSVRLCLIAIVTCPEDGWRKTGESSTILDTMVGGRYRLPSLSAKTRLAAFSGALKQESLNLQLDDTAMARLPVAAASAAWAKGSAFRRVATKLREIVKDKSDPETHIVTTQDLERALAWIKNDSADFAQVSFQAQEDSTSSSSSSLQSVGNTSLFESVGGNTQAKVSLEDALALDPNKRRMLARFGLSPPTGILLYGPPGCGKTLLAKAVAKLLKAPSIGGGQSDSLALGGTFISLSSSDIVRAEIGTSEKILVSAFDFADKNAPSVIFLDEFQALFTERSRGGSGKLATTLIQCLDDIKRWRDVANSTQEGEISASSIPEESMEGNRVIVLGATNTPWVVDSAFLRPGRFDRVVHVGLPTTSERESILQVHVSRMRILGRDDPAFLTRLCATIAELTPGLSGADLAALCRAAAIRALLHIGDDGEIEEPHFLEALDKDVRASSDDDLVQRLLKWRP